MDHLARYAWREDQPCEGEHRVFGFLTREPNAVIGPIHPKAMPVTRATGGKVAMLLNLGSLCHPSRTTFWQEHPPARSYAIDRVVCWPFHRHGPAPQALRRDRYCWVIWRQEHRGAPAFGWFGRFFRPVMCPSDR